MDENRPRLIVEAKLGDADDFRSVYPDFWAKVSDFEQFGEDEWGFLVVFGGRYDKTVQEDDLMDFLVENHIELSYLRANYGAQLAAELYISASHPAGMLAFEPELLGLCGGLGIRLEITPLE